MCWTEQGGWPPLLASTSTRAKTVKHTVTVTKRSTKGDIGVVCVGAKLRLGSGALAGDVMDKLVWGVATLIHRNNVFNIYIDTRQQMSHLPQESHDDASHEILDFPNFLLCHSLWCMTFCFE